MSMESTAPEDRPPVTDLASHQRQYARFVHLTKWFVIHMVVLLVALYFLVIASQMVTGSIILVLAIGALVYGILSVSQIARDAAAAVEHRPDPTN